VTLSRVDDEEQTSTDALASAILRLSNDPVALGELTNIDILREFPIDSLPEHDDNLVVEVGEFFTWAWPFFASSVTGQWPPSNPEPPPDEDVDEDAPVTLEGLSALTSLPVPFLEELEEALLAKQQAVLVGPPGTSKTYIARQFARYFVAQHAGRSQGNHHVLYMHANWTYEDFFEGIKPVAREDGQLTFERQKGLFLEWVEQLSAGPEACLTALRGLMSPQ
jgi:hypothetical protein